MANYQKNSLVTYIFFISALVQANNHISFKPWQGRLGDQLWNVCKSLMLADKYALPFIGKQFLHSDKFPLYQKKHEHEYSHTKIIKVFHETDIEKNIPKENVLFLTNFYTRPDDILYNYCLRHKDFQHNLKTLFTPQIETEQLQLPTDKITVALHIRKGCKTDQPQSSLQEYDLEENAIRYIIDQQELPVCSAERKIKSKAIDRRYPLKFPPHQYYIEALKKLSELLHNQPLYVHIFTDHHNPEMLLKKIKQAVNLPNITWQTRSNKIKQETTIFDDFYAMMQFNCLIRSDSSFSKVVQLLGNFQAIIYPINGTWHDNKLIIEQVGVILHDKPPFDYNIIK